MQPNELHNFDTLERNVEAFNQALGQGFWDAIFADPMFYLGYLFAFAAAIAFLIFLRGFLSGLPKVFTMDWHEEHQEHHRVRVTWGFFLLLYLFVVWQLVRFVAGGVSSVVGG